MFDAAKVWWVILTQIGPRGRTLQQLDLWIRCFIAEALQEIGLFDYLAEPRPYGQIIAEFGFVDFPYTRDVFATLSSGKDNLLIREGERYRRNPAEPLPDHEDVARRTNQLLRDVSIFRDIAQLVPVRMRQEQLAFTHRLDDVKSALFGFDNSLSTRIYAALRNAAFAFINEKELRGKRLLDVGCGSGYETADMWLRLKGDVQITAIDPTPGLLNLAGERFSQLVSESKRRGLPPVTEVNRPSFHLMSAMNLEFPDESFDAVYHAVMLHWVADPQQCIREMARVLKPGGLVFGVQSFKPNSVSAYVDLAVRVHEGVYGFCWEEEFKQWYKRSGVTISMAVNIIFKGRKVL